jgi:hypothetical protein
VTRLRHGAMLSGPGPATRTESGQIGRVSLWPVHMPHAWRWSAAVSCRG